MSGARFVRFYPSDWRSGCIGLTPEEEGAYIRICAHFWETGIRLPLDDAIAASRLMMDVRMYRRLRGKLIAKGKLHEAEDGFYVPRAERELAAANRAAKKEGAQADMGTTRGSPDGEHANGRDQVEGRCAGTDALTGHHADVQVKSPESLGEVSEKDCKKPIKINGPLKTYEPVANSHTEDNKPVSSESGAADGHEEVSGLNGSTTEIVRGVAKLLNNLAPDYAFARQIVASNVGIYGPNAVRDGYAELQADIADNKVRIPSVKTLVGYFKTASERRKNEPEKKTNRRPVFNRMTGQIEWRAA